MFCVLEKKNEKTLYIRKHGVEGNAYTVMNVRRYGYVEHIIIIYRNEDDLTDENWYDLFARI